MDAANEFYISLPSDYEQSLKLFPRNKPGSYTVHLPYDLNLDGSWQVALDEIQFQHTWMNFTQDSHLTLVTLLTGETTADDKSRTLFTKDHFTLTAEADNQNIEVLHITLPAGYYETPSMINEVLSRFIRNEVIMERAKHDRSQYTKSYLNLRYDHIQKKAEMKDGYYETKLFSDDAGGHFAALGFRPTEYEHEIPEDHENYEYWVSTYKNLKYYKSNKRGTRMAKEQVYLKKNPTIFIYCSVIEPQIVGGTQVKLMRTIAIDGDASNVTISNFNRIHYRPVSKGYIRTIEIELRNNKGEYINFQDGEVNCLLHFRKCHLYK